MRLLQPELDELEDKLPGLRKRLDEMSWDEREVVGRSAIEAFREAGGSGLLVTQE
jgi:hypothetical protein